MAGSSYTHNKSTPFFSAGDSDDIDDATFLKGSRGYQSSTLEERRQQLLEEKKKIEERTIQSSMRSIGLLQQSEEIGNATAQELAQQREKLENTEQRLDEINSSLRASQRHIQGIKSVFGSIRNYFSGSKDQLKMVPETHEESQKVPKSKSELSQVLKSVAEDTTEIKEKSTASSWQRSESIPAAASADEVLDSNLEHIGSALTRLKGLGMNLHSELEDQNSMLERITGKTENVDFRIQQQNKDMNRILKK